ncbi:MAG: NAD(P)/FAD-dependent oxidoreductase [Acidimicrobiales bacterium]
MSAAETTAATTATTTTDHDVIIIGAGVAGIYQLYKLRDTGLSVRVLEAGSNVGGTWYWNRYPLARFDSESYSYGYFFSREVLDEWEWSEHFAGQPETERYLNFVVDKFGLRDHFQFNARVTSAVFDESCDRWRLTTGDGATCTARYVISATGLLSAPYFPDIPGRDTFQGEAYHTGLWPKEPVSFAGKKVAMIGTGASAVQLLPGIVDEVGSITVYQRTPNWCAPLNNGLITAEEQEEIRAGYEELERLCRSTFAGFAHADGTRSTFEDSKEQRWAFYESLWTKRGFAKLFSNYNDILVDPKANAEFCEYLAHKIRERVSDPATAEKLIPTDHGYGMKRPPMETGYYEAYNRPHCTLVDLHETPIERITETGIVTSAGEERFDMIIWATGFDAVTGALTRMGVVGRGGEQLADFWADGPRTYLGVSIPRFPNFAFVGGPHFPFANVPRGVDPQVDFVTDLVVHAAGHGYTFEPDEAAEEAWTEHVLASSAPFLVADTSWFRGANIPGKADRFMLYTGGLVTYTNRLNEVTANGYDGFTLHDAGATVAHPA